MLTKKIRVNRLEYAKLNMLPAWIPAYAAMTMK